MSNFLSPAQRCGPQPESVKLRIANVSCSLIWGRGHQDAILNAKNTAKINIFTQTATFRRGAAKAPAKIDENRSLPYKPRQLSADGPISCRAAQLGLEMARFGQATITGRDLIQQANLPRSAENDP